MAEQRNVRDDEAYCRVHGEASGPTSDDVPCPLPHAAARCPVCSQGWIGPGPSDSVVLCILTRHIVETHPNTAHATTLRFNAGQLGGSRIPPIGVTTTPSSTVVSRSSSRCREFATSGRLGATTPRCSWIVFTPQMNSVTASCGLE